MKFQKVPFNIHNIFTKVSHGNCTNTIVNHYIRSYAHARKFSFSCLANEPSNHVHRIIACIVLSRHKSNIFANTGFPSTQLMQKVNAYLKLRATREIFSTVKYVSECMGSLYIETKAEEQSCAALHSLQQRFIPVARFSESEPVDTRKIPMSSNTR